MTDTSRKVRRWSVQLDVFRDDDWAELGASHDENMATALAWVWCESDPSARVRVVDVRTGNVVWAREPYKPGKKIDR
jgi:hypothetical protein